MSSPVEQTEQKALKDRSDDDEEYSGAAGTEHKATPLFDVLLQHNHMKEGQRTKVKDENQTLDGHFVIII
jgi:hypothetical protein